VSQVETTPHEIEGRWKWPDWGRGPYDALSSVMLGPPFEGYLEIGTEIDGEPWHLEVRYSKSGFAPRLSDRINAERLYEWDIVGRGRGERKASYNIGPRFPNMRHWESGERLQLPWENQVGEVDGVDVEYHTSNIEADRGLELLRRSSELCLSTPASASISSISVRNRTRRAECGRTSATFESVASGRKSSRRPVCCRRSRTTCLT